MRQLITIALIFIVAKATAQVEIAFGNYDPFFDTTKSLSPHSAVKPIMRNTNDEVGYALNDREENKTFVYPVVNQLGLISSSESGLSSVRTGVGVGFSSTLNDKFHIRGTVLGSYFEGDEDIRNSILPNTYFWNGNDEVRREVQPNIRASFTPNKFFNFQAGIDQNFIGEGERSMILGDYGAPYPFFQMRSSLWKFEFVNIYQFFRERDFNNDWVPKYASSHYLNFQATERFQFGVFESVIFQPTDTLLKRGYEWEYLNPFLFYRPAEYKIGSQDKVVIGTHFSYNLDFLMIYGQFVLDEFLLNELVNRTRWWGNKYAGQFGFKGKGTIKNVNIEYLSEINFSRPFTFTHLDYRTNYAHQGMALGHPLGANFVESYSTLSLAFKNDLKIKTTFMFAQQGGLDSNEEFGFGEDIYRTYTEKPFEHGYFIGGNGKLNRARWSVEVSYPVIKKLKIDAFIRPIFEWRTGAVTGQTTFVFAGIRTALWNERSLSF